MKKRLYMILLIVGMLATGCGTGNEDRMAEEQIQEEISEEGDSAETAQAEFDFGELKDLEFYFASGAGAWRTVMQIKEDGSFLGRFSDSEMGAVAEGYPNGTYYVSDFEGKFSDPVRINEYTYSMAIEEIHYQKEVGTEEIIDGVLYCYSDAYGLAGAEEMLVYLPGAPFKKLPESYQMWVRNDMTDAEAAELPFYGLYNEEEENGFSSYDISNRIDDLMMATEEWSNTLKAALENDPLTQTEMNLKSMELYDIWDEALNTFWTELKKEMPEEEFQKLLSEQREWISEKEEAVLESGKEVEGGSMYPLVVNTKAASITEARVYELYEILKQY